MNKTIKIILIIILWVISLQLIASHSNANEEINKAKERIAELNQLIDEEKNNYAIAEFWYYESLESWQKEMDKAHNKAEEYRAEIKRLEGFIQSRQAQK